MTLGKFVEVVKRSRRNYFPVEDSETGKFLGMIHLNDIRPYLFNTMLYNTVILEEIMDTNLEKVTPDQSLSEILAIFDRTHTWSLPVVKDNKFLGLISKATLLDHYRKELIVEAYH
jgi:CIC family chloride channel protein